MRKLNGILAAAILLLFLIHGVFGSLLMVGAWDVLSKGISHTMLTLIAVHAVLSVILTANALKAMKKTGTAYFRENRLFWARRFSGFAIMILVFLHMTAFGDDSTGIFIPYPFEVVKLTVQLLFLACVAVHVISNVRPALITFGIRRLRPGAAEILFILGAALLFMAVAFVVYFLRWRSF